MLRDLGSSNGTRLGGHVITEQEVSDGDVLQSGDVTARLSQQDGSAISVSKKEQASDTTPIHESSIVLSAAHLSGRDRKTDSLAAGAQADTGDMLAALVTVAQELLRTPEIEPLLAGIASLIFRYIPVEDAFILLHEPETGELVPRITRNRNGGPAQGRQFEHRVAFFPARRVHPDA